MSEIVNQTNENLRHTPEPWFVVAHPDGTWTIQSREEGAGECIAQKYGDSPLDNARIIGVAPGLLRLLTVMYDKWENGVDVYEDPESNTGYCGKAFSLTEKEEQEILTLLDKCGIRTTVTVAREMEKTA